MMSAGGLCPRRGERGRAAVAVSAALLALALAVGPALAQHDIAAGTATPKAYEFAWNDDAIAMNQFAGILTNATEGVAATLDTEAKGVPIVVFNPLNVER